MAVDPKKHTPGLASSFSAASLTATASAAPAGGTGATAGAYDTAAHRDAMIASLNTTITRVTEIENALKALGFLQ